MILYQECQHSEFKSTYRFVNAAQRVWCLIKRFADQSRQWEEITRQRRTLLAMDDRMLKDIGLSRADAVRLTSSPGFLEFMFKRATGDRRTPDTGRDR